MNAFDKIIGYDAIKSELEQICDMIKNKEIYETLGAKLPHGVLLYGDPGLGKSLMAKCFIAESGLPSFVIRRTKGGEKFVDEIIDTFEKAKAAAPAVVFLDDLDKFANEDRCHPDTEEYVAVQAGIDDTADCGVFVIATVNDEDKLPESLIRAGRFDRSIEVKCPTEEDAERIVRHYLKDKKCAPDLDMNDLVKMISYSSCAELETILNEAAVYAGFERKTAIEMDDLVRAVLRMQYESPDDNDSSDETEKTMIIAMHEAGHLVVSEALCEGSVGLASIRPSGRNAHGGFIHRCKRLPSNEADILVFLAGRAATELYYADAPACASTSDFRSAVCTIREDLRSGAARGFGLLNERHISDSENLTARLEAVEQAEMERYLQMARGILLKNRDFLEKCAKMLAEKQTLLYSDIAALRRESAVTPVSA